MVTLILTSVIMNAKNQALLVGIGTYNSEKTGWNKINGNNDADLLESKLKKQGYNITTLKDSKATKNNVKSALNNLVATAKAGDIVYIHFSGHGQLVEDLTGEEPDGFDQSFVCYDACYSSRYNVNGTAYKGENHFIDDELFPYLNQLKSNVGPKGKIIVAFDSCYSGGADRGEIMDDQDSDSDYEFTSTSRGTDDQFFANKTTKPYLKSIKAPGIYKKDGGELLVISACERDRKNWETIDRRSGRQYGSLTLCISKMIENNIPVSQWADFFTSKKYKNYKIFRSTQHPVIENH